MFGARLELSCTLETLSPLHCGTGDQAALERSGGRNEPLQYASVQRDHMQRPYLPASSLKGAIRQFAFDRLPERKSDLLRLFGNIDPKLGDMRMGSLTLFGAQCPEAAPASVELPFSGALKRSSAYVTARTAINGASGVADDHKLFHSEAVQAGTLFTLRALVLNEQPGSPLWRLAEEVFELLARDGFSLGKSRAGGDGRLRIREGSLTSAEWRISAEGELKSLESKPLAAAVSGGPMPGVETFELVCTGPFLIQDSGAREGHDARDPARNKKGSAPQIQAQRSSGNQPLLPGSSVAGALRARAIWLWRKKMLRSGQDIPLDDPEPVKRLFGMTGHMALLHIVQCAISEAEPIDITSVRLDRFSGAPVDNALFTTRAFLGAKLTLGLILTSRPGFEPDDDDRKLFKLLCADINDHGLDLGAGSNKGFGWFVKAGGG
jgi:CRISPR/Cas system CSM-associated protein Csm3 (group 7 of RAMP superfamily)